MNYPSNQIPSASPSNQQGQPKGRLAFIDTLRGLAACAVFLTHIHAYWLDNVRPTGVNPTRIVTFFAGTGFLGVDLFIVLSGFCLFFPIVRSPTLRGFDARTFYRRRAYRLLPTYYVALIIAIALALVPMLQPYLVGRPVQGYDVAAYFFLIQTWWSRTTGSINGSFWSIALEVQLYLVFPLLLLLHRRYGLKAVLTLGVVTTLMWPVLCHVLATRLGWDFDPSLHFPSRWIEFIAGMVAARVVSRFSQEQSDQDQGTVRMMIGARWVCLITIPLTIVLNTGISQILHLPDGTTHILAGLAFGSLIVALAGIPERPFVAGGSLSLLTRVGFISYSLYAIHQPLLLLTAPYFRAHQWSVLSTFAIGMVVALPLALLLASLLFVGVERPCMRLGKSTRAA